MVWKQNTAKKEKMKERVLGIDFGGVNMGLALGVSGLTMPLQIIPATNQNTAINAIARVVYENKITKIIIGLPVTAEGKLTTQALEVKKFIKLLSVRIKIPIVLVNEFLSTREALTEAIGIGFSKKRRSRIDHLSAEVVLRRYFESSH
ncbi:MAG: Holliday junction resolvase RuvX [Patescibacteria group bacterium]